MTFDDVPIHSSILEVKAHPFSIHPYPFVKPKLSTQSGKQNSALLPWEIMPCTLDARRWARKLPLARTIDRKNILPRARGTGTGSPSAKYRNGCKLLMAMIQVLTVNIPGTAAVLIHWYHCCCCCILRPSFCEKNKLLQPPHANVPCKSKIYTVDSGLHYSLWS